MPSPAEAVAAARCQRSRRPLKVSGEAELLQQGQEQRLLHIVIHVVPEHHEPIQIRRELAVALGGRELPRYPPCAKPGDSSTIVLGARSW